MKLILRILLTALAVILLAYFLPGIDVANYTSAIFVAIILGLLRITVKPILIILTLPVTVITLGLFLLVINAIIILIAGSFIDGFTVSGFWWALLFSILLSFVQSVFYGLIEDKPNN